MRMGVVIAVLAVVAALATACAGRAPAADNEVGRPRAHDVRTVRMSPSQKPDRLPAFCRVAGSADHLLRQSPDHLHLVLHAFDRFKAVAPTSARLITRTVIREVTRALARRRQPNVGVLKNLADSFTQWDATHCFPR